MNASEVLHLTGANGAGKTSLLRILAGALPAAAGNILWNGEDIFAENGTVAEGKFNFLPADDRSLKALETGRENLAFWAALWNLPEEACDAALQSMDMKKHQHKPVRNLSAGQRRRLSLARAIMKPAPLWLLDEPFNGLDVDAQALFSQALELHMTKDGIAVVASHFSVEPPRQGRLQRLDIAQYAPKIAA